jgi:dienelactone hydrolase
MNRIASHGFVAIADVTTTDADGAPLKASMEWLIGENARQQSMFYQMLDTSKIAVGGHSIGSVNAFAIADDPRLTTSIHVAGGSLDNQGSSALKLTHPAAYICSESDLFGNVEKAQADYKVTTVPVFLTVMTGSDHVNAARDGLGAIVAWLRWHLGGETERRSMFLDPMGEFTTGKFVSQSKNW